MTSRRLRNKLIDEVLVKSKRRCSLCYRETGDKDLKTGDIAHIVPLTGDGSNEISNLVYLCREHHVEYDKREGEAKVREVKAAREDLYSAMDLFESSMHVERPRVFVISGHDETAKQQVLKFLNEVDVEAVTVDREQGFGTSTIELIEGTPNIHYAIAVLTANVPGFSMWSNVVFELGLLVGILGRRKVSVLVKTGVDTPSEIKGVLYLEMDSRGRWRKALSRELLEAGLPISP